MYKVQPFIWQDVISDKTFFQTQCTSVIITNKKIRDFLIEIEQKNILEFENNFIEIFFKNETASVVNFLIQNGLIKEKIERDFCVDRLVLLTEDESFFKAMQFNMNNIYNIVRIKENDKFEWGEKDLCIVFLNPFNLEKMNQITSFIKDRNVMAKFIFPYNNKIYFTNFYKKSWYNPCPMCFFYMLESQLRGENEEKGINFQTLIDLLYSQKATFDIHLPLDNTVYIQIIYHLLKYLKKTENDYTLDEVLEICLSDFSINKDSACHWGYCDCYE